MKSHAASSLLPQRAISIAGCLSIVGPLTLLAGVACTSNAGEGEQVIQSAIVGGNESVPGKYPWMAQISVKPPGGSTFVPACGGALIAPNWILTAAHCLYEGGTALPVGSFRVTLGEHTLDTTEPSEQIKNVVEAVPHPNFASPSIDDIGLLRLDSNAQLNQRVQILRLAVDGDAVNQTAWISGWGSTLAGGGGGPSNVLKELFTQVVGFDDHVFPDVTCREVAQHYLSTDPSISRDLNNGDLCIAINYGDGTQNATCYGDSGSPLVAYRSSVCAEEIGILVTGDYLCSKYNITMRISTRLDWIRSKVPSVASSNVYEAESMAHSTGGSYPNGWNIWANGYASFSKTFVGGLTQMVVTAAGQYGNGWPIMQVTVNGTVVYTQTVGSSTFADYPFVFNAPSGNAEVRVNFTNDYVSGQIDRNLLLDKVKVVYNTCATANPLNAQVNVYDDWGTGYCARVKLTNLGATATTSWHALVDTGNSSVYQSWNAGVISGTGTHSISSVAWNGPINPGASYDQTGFCANRAAGTNTMPTIVNSFGNY
jgi:secreted trypsin-like serine protease